MIKRIVLIDDDPTVNLINSGLIEVSLPDAHVISFHDPREALKYLLNAGENDRDSFPEILMIDINMQKMDGWKFLELLSHFPTSVLTGLKTYLLASSISEHDIDKSRRCSLVSGFLSKPLLLEAVEVVFQSKGRTPEAGLPHRA